MAKPKLRFPEFAEEWEEKQFCNIATISGGYAFDSKKMTNVPAKYQVVKMGNLYQGKLDLDRTPSFIENATEKELEYLIQENDIGITLTGTVNKHDYGYSYRFSNEKNLLLNQRLGLIRAKQSVDAVFLSSVVKGKNFLTQFYNISTGGTGNQTNVSTKGIEKIMVSVPILKEQQKIADLLSSVDGVIQIQEEKIAVLDEQKKGIMQKLFNRKVRFKADDGREFPEWEERRLEDIAIIKMGQSPNSSSYNDEHIGLPLIQGNADMSGRVSAPQRYTSEPTKECNIGDIIMTVRAPVGFVGKSIHHACIGRGVCAISSKINTEFLFQYLVSIEDSWKRIEQGSTFTAIGGNEVKKLILLIPCIQEQQKIADCLLTYDEAIQIKKDKLEIWKEIKKGLLQQMFV